MNAKPTRPHAPMLTLGDIYYIVFRHKWKIMAMTAIGVLVGLALPFLWPSVYESQAKLLVKYVVDNRAPSDPAGNSHVSLPDAAGRNIINTELQILTSIDLAQEVATNIGAEKILGKAHANMYEAAAVIHNNLVVDVPNNSDVISISFRHKDPTIVQAVLAQVIAAYLDRHKEIHRPEGTDELTRDTEQLRARLAGTEELLRNAKTNLGIISLEDAEKMFGEKISKIQTDIEDSSASLAQHQAAMDELSKRINVDELPTNKVNTANADTNAVSPEKITDYKRISSMLDAFREEEKKLLVQFLPGNSRVQEIRDQINSVEKQKKQLEDETPGLLSVKVEETKTGDTTDAALKNNLIAEVALVVGLQSKIRVLTNELSEVKARFAAVDAGASTIVELERTRKLEESHYNYYMESLETAQINDTVGPGKGSNINTIQNPSPPYRNMAKMIKTSAGICVLGLIIGLGLAFLIEIYIDHTVKRPGDIEARLGVPFFLSIPYRNGNGKVPLLNAPPKNALLLRSVLTESPFPLNTTKTTIGRLPENALPVDDGSVSPYHCEILSRNGEFIVKDLGSTNGTFVSGERIVEMTLKAGQTLRIGSVEFKVETQETAKDLPLVPQSTAATPPWDPRHALRPFYDTLRDRLITYFEVKNLTHNPKLVALTSCGGSAGVSSTAAGLAAALSETGEGNVLLVDMNVERGAAHHFYKGHLSCGIDDALKKDKRHEALVQNNLYVVTESSNEESLPRVLPKRFTNLVPKLKASDYDYIIFDMPPMSQISITPRLARFMDMVMVVVESEKTDREVVQRAVTMLTDTRANVGVVLNKRKTYVPQRIKQNFD